MWIGRLGGLKGGKARAEKLTPEQRKEMAGRAAKIRWEHGKPYLCANCLRMNTSSKGTAKIYFPQRFLCTNATLQSDESI